MTVDPRSLWQELTKAELSEFEAEMLTEMLTAAILAGESHVVVVSYADEEETATDAVLTLSIIDGRNTIFGQVYEHPGRVVSAIFKDWLAPGIDEDGSLSDDEEVEQDEFDRLLASFADGAEEGVLA